MSAAAAELLADGLRFPEGPRWRDGRLWVSDFYDKAVFTYTLDGAREKVCDVPGQPSGLGWSAGGELLISSMLDQRLLALDAESGALREVADLSALAGGPCNDLFTDPAGRAYVGNFGSDVASGIVPARLLRVDPDGSVHGAADDLVFPNGVVVIDGATMVVAETFAYRLSAFDVAADGSLSNRRVWADFSDGTAPAATLDDVLARPDLVAPDGTCLDAEGAIWVADATGTGAVRVTEGGAIVDAVELDGLTAFAVALGGEDGRTLFLAAGPPLGEIDPATERRGAIYTARVDVPAAA